MNVADIITAVDGIPIKKAEDFMTIIEERKPKDRIALDVYREGRTVKVSLTLD
jgi:S1-C subfamily serine protease